MFVNMYSYRMCAKIDKYIKIWLQFLNEDHILHFFLLYKDFFDKLYFIANKNEANLIPENFLLGIIFEVIKLLRNVIQKHDVKLFLSI